MKREILSKFIFSQKFPPIFLCIGSPKVTGDCFGPITGQLLSDFFRLPCEVIGTLAKPVHALNLIDTLDFLAQCRPERKIIAIDSAIGTKTGENAVKFCYGGIKPGLATGKDLPMVGDFSIIATVATGSPSELYKTPLSAIYAFAKQTALSIASCFSDYDSKIQSHFLTL